MRAKLNFGSLWNDASEVAVAKLATWNEGNAVAVQAALANIPCPFTARDFPLPSRDIPAAVARIGSSRS
jgi:hypothetical protein